MLVEKKMVVATFGRIFPSRRSMIKAILYPTPTAISPVLLVIQAVVTVDDVLQIKTM